ncbi:hypothetical protein Gotri_004611 [Gossypium trilobum]|uniref:Uncharacterized protein n=1 Tax=Gossypium trilobum TaxID=34281 RepID=A0A7J9F5S8_9ROSI|nr:hypothetical protein [Gossypium trilobum]
MSQNFACGAIKESNLSPGEGHKFSDSRTIRGIKVTSSSPADVGNKFTVKYGPSPSVGKALTDSHTIGGIKDTGPSLDVGNKLTDSQTVDDIKASVECNRPSVRPGKCCCESNSNMHQLLLHLQNNSFFIVFHIRLRKRD